MKTLAICLETQRERERAGAGRGRGDISTDGVVTYRTERVGGGGGGLPPPLPPPLPSPLPDPPPDLTLLQHPAPPSPPAPILPKIAAGYPPPPPTRPLSGRISLTPSSSDRGGGQEEEVIKWVHAKLAEYASNTLSKCFRAGTLQCTTAVFAPERDWRIRSASRIRRDWRISRMRQSLLMRRRRCASG
jgi:hypothetical protein